MILNRNESEVTILGDVQKYKVSIDEKNLQHIITILSSNLYSHPMQSFLREIVSNAVDSHIEAGVNEPIIITVTDNDLSIRDFGTGISPERFKDVFINIGSSTKRESNGFIGYFGIGKYSSLAVADVVNITSFYNGKAYYYVMNKDIDQLHIDLILERDTNEHNGVEVKIPYKTSLYVEDWKCLSFIKNVYIEDERKSSQSVNQRDIISSFNRRKVYSYNTFKVLDIKYPYTNGGSTEVLVGTIPYRVDYDLLWDGDKYYDKWEEAFKVVYPCIQIGEVDITPNREGLLYSERTKKALCKAYDAAIEELTQLWEDSCKEEYTDFKKFAYAVKDHYENTLNLHGVEVTISEDLPYNIKMKDFPECSFDWLRYSIRALLFSSSGHNVIACLNRNEMQKGKNLLNSPIKDILDKCDNNNTTLIAVPDAHGFSSKYIKGFLSEQFPDQKVMLLKEPRISISRVKNFIRNVFGITAISDADNFHTIIACIRHLLKYFSQHVRRWDIINSPEYTRYKEAHREKKLNTNIYNNTQITCRIWWPHETSPETYTDTPNKMINMIHTKYKKHRIVYAPLDSPFILGFRCINYPYLCIIGLSQNNYTLAEKGLFPDYVRPIEELYSEDNRVLQKIAAVEFIKSKMGIHELPSAFPEPIREMSCRLLNIMNKYRHGSNYLCPDGYDILKVVPKEKYDRAILALFNQTEKYQVIYNRVNYDRHSDYNYSFRWYFLMKVKKFRPSYNYYRDVRDSIEHITNLL